MRRVRGRPGKSTRRSKANEPKAPKRLSCALEDTTWAIAKTEGMTTAALAERLMAKKSGSFALTHPAMPDHNRRVAGSGGDVTSLIGPSPIAPAAPDGEHRPYGLQNYSDNAERPRGLTGARAGAVANSAQLSPTWSGPRAGCARPDRCVARSR